MALRPANHPYRSLALAWFPLAGLAACLCAAPAHADAGVQADTDASPDSDGDGRSDRSECKQGSTCVDTDRDGRDDAHDEDDDADGISSRQELRDGDAHGHDVDGDRARNWLDADSDGDAIPDQLEPGDLDHDGTPDYLEPNSVRLKGGGGASCSVHDVRAADFAPWLLSLLAALALIRRRA